MTHTSAQLRSVNNTLCETAQTSTTGRIGGVEELYGFRNLLCLWENRDLLIDKYNRQFDSECHRPCSEYMYDTSVSATSQWPTTSNQRQFYESYIADMPYADKFSSYKDIFELVDNGTISLVGVHWW